MRTLNDFEGRAIRLTDERRRHILGRPEMATFERAVGGKFLCVVVKLAQADAFVVTAYLTDRVKKGEQIWPRKP